jgi:hypothetical protein
MALLVFSCRISVWVRVNPGIFLTGCLVNAAVASVVMNVAVN